ncbi:MAG: hypothetical protein R6V75_09710 [Bacteroidales bacterium]
MEICPNCGIELESEYSKCPLCQVEIRSQKQSRPRQLTTYPGQERPLNISEKIHLFWELSGILHFSSIVMTLLIDIILHRQPGWSLITLTCITASFIYITLLVHLSKRLLLFLGGLLLNTVALIFFLDLLKGGITWFVLPGLPLTGFFILLLGMVLVFTRRTSQRGFNVIGATALAVGIYIMIIEVSVSLALNQTFKLSWSVIVAASILPFALLLFYFHYRLKRGTSLRKFFHL